MNAKESMRRYIKSTAIISYKFECCMCSSSQEEAETIEELVDVLFTSGWKDCIIGESEGIFCPDCQQNQGE